MELSRRLRHLFFIIEVEKPVYHVLYLVLSTYLYNDTVQGPKFSYTWNRVHNFPALSSPCTRSEALKRWGNLAEYLSKQDRLLVLVVVCLYVSHFSVNCQSKINRTTYSTYVVCLYVSHLSIDCQSKINPTTYSTYVHT